MTNRAQCPICFGLDIKHKGTKNAYSILTCTSCRHWWASGVSPLNESDEFLAQYSNFDAKTAEQEFDKLSLGENTGSHLHRVDQFLRFLLRTEGWIGSSHLDVGCGSGYLLAQSKAAGLEVQGIEPGPWASHAAERWQIPVEQGFLRHRHFQRTFDLVTATDVLEHQADPALFLQLLTANVSANGLIVLTFPCIDSFNARLLGTYWCMVAPPTHCQFFSLKSAAKLADRCQLRIVAYRQYNAGGFPILSRSHLFTNVYSRLLDRLNLGDQLLVALRLKTHS